MRSRKSSTNESEDDCADNIQKLPADKQNTKKRDKSSKKGEKTREGENGSATTSACNSPQLKPLKSVAISNTHGTSKSLGSLNTEDYTIPDFSLEVSQKENAPVKQGFLFRRHGRTKKIIGAKSWHQRFFILYKNGLLEW